MGCVYNGITVEGEISDISINPCTRGELVVKPVLGDGVFVKRGQMQTGSVSFSVSTETDTEVGTVAQNLANLTGFVSTLSIDSVGIWNAAMLTEVGQLTVKATADATLISYSLTFTLYP